MLFTALPLADETRGDVQVAGEHGLACALALAQRPDFLGCQRAHGRQARFIEPAHGLLIHHASRVQPFRRFVDRGRFSAPLSGQALLGQCPPQAPERTGLGPYG